MAANECKCMNPEKGGVKCPPQHIALCIRGRDRECYGECIPIPNSFKAYNSNFGDWMESKIQNNVYEYIKGNWPFENTDFSITNIRSVEFTSGGIYHFKVASRKFQIIKTEILYARFNFIFDNDDLGNDYMENMKIQTM